MREGSAAAVEVAGDEVSPVGQGRTQRRRRQQGGSGGFGGHDGGFARATLGRDGLGDELPILYQCDAAGRRRRTAVPAFEQRRPVLDKRHASSGSEYDAKQTFQTSSKAGKAGFGGVEKRSLLLSNMITKPPGSGWTGPIEDTPGPAAYDSQVDEKGREHNMYTLNGVEKMKSAAFASKSQRATVVLPNAFVPGPGAYKPDDSATIEHLPGANPKANPLSKTGRDHHFVADNLDGMGDDSSTQPHVGPGSYNSHLHLTISRAWEVAAEELPHASFMSDTFRTIYTGQNE